MEDIFAVFPVSWPLARFTDEQIADAIECEGTAYSQATELYPEDLPIDELQGALPLETACDWATLAVVYALRGQNDIGAEAYLTAIYLNPAYSMVNDLLFEYFGSETLVESPPFVEQQLSSATIEYDYSGIGYTGSYSITITNFETTPYVTGSGTEESSFSDEDGPATNNYTVDQAIDKEVVEPLGRAFTNLIPVDTEVELLACYDNYPDWVLELVYIDGTTITAKTHGSNAIGVGGPWQVLIDGQHYVQMSYDLVDVIIDIHDTLELPWGQTAAMNCPPPSSILQLGFPDR